MPTIVTPVIQPNTWMRAITTNSTATGFASKIPTITEPIPSLANGIYDVGGRDVLEVIPFGTNGDNDTFSLRVIGWRKHRGPIGTNLWIPNVLAELSTVLGTVTGVADSEVVATEYFADTIALVSNGGAATIYTQTAGNTVAAARVTVTGYKYVEFSWDLAGAQEGVSMNALFTTY